MFHLKNDLAKKMSLTQRLLASLSVGLLLALPAANALAESQTQPAPQAATSPADHDIVNMKVTVTSVQGMVQVRTAEDQPWQPAKIGLELGAGAEFRTGIRSAVQFRIPPDQIITLDRLGIVKVIQAVKDAGKSKTDLGMKYGRTRFDIEATGGEYEATIRSPAATLAIRGTIACSYDQGFYQPQFTSLQHQVWIDRHHHHTTTVGGNTPASFGENSNNAADDSLHNSTTYTGPYGGSPHNDLVLQQNFPTYSGDYLTTLGFLGFKTQNDLNNAINKFNNFAAVTTNTSPFAIRVFDSGLEDGDVVAVLLNKKVINEYLPLTTTGQILQLNLNPGKNILTLIDVSNGTDNNQTGVGIVNSGAINLPSTGKAYPFIITQMGDGRNATITYTPQVVNNAAKTKAATAATVAKSR